MLQKSREFFSSKGFDEAPQVLVNGVQLDVTEVRTMVLYQQPTLLPLITGSGDWDRGHYSETDVPHTASNLHRKHTINSCSMNIFFQNKLTDQMNVYDYLLNKSDVLERLNKHVVTKGQQLDLSGRGMQSVAEDEQCDNIVPNFCSSGREGWRSV